MSADAVPWDEALLPPEQRPQWRADTAALRDFRDQAELLPLKMGDCFNELKARWGEKMPVLAKQAGVPYHQARQRAHVAACLPPDSRYRTMGLPFSILRMIVSLPEPRPWAEKARALQLTRKLKVREFARMLEAAGLRQPRARKAPRCLHCKREVGETPDRLYFRRGETTGWLCNRTCALAYLEPFCDPEPPPATSPPDGGVNKDVQDRQDDGEGEAPVLSSCLSCTSLLTPLSGDSESQNRVPRPVPRHTRYRCREPPFRRAERENGILLRPSCFLCVFVVHFPAGRPGIASEARERGPPSRCQWTTMPAWESVKARKAPTANRGIR
jgi:hypothetical protein